MSDKSKISIVINENLKKQASAIAEANGENISTVVRRYLKRYVRHAEKADRCPVVVPKKPDQNTNIVINKYNHIDIIDL
jgi:DNA-damage-inducible protein J